MEKKMPKATAKRLPVYLRYLKMLGILVLNALNHESLVK